MICERCGSRVPHHVPGAAACKRRRLGETFECLQSVFQYLAEQTDSAREIPRNDRVKEASIDNVDHLRDVHNAAVHFVQAFEQWDAERMDLERENPSPPPVSTTSTQSDPSTQVDSPAHAAKRCGVYVALDGSVDGPILEDL